MMKSNAKKPLIIGYGNPLRGDDGLGSVVVARLHDHLTFVQATLLSPQQLTFDLAPDMHAASQVILIDAATQGAAGTLTTYRITPDSVAMHTLQHHVKPAALLTAVSTLYGTPPPTTLVAVVGQQWDAGQGLSDVVQAVIPDVIATVLALIVT